MGGEGNGTKGIEQRLLAEPGQLRLEVRQRYRRGCPISCLLYQACNGESGQSNQLKSFTRPRLKCGKGSVLLLVWSSTQRRVTWSFSASSSAVRREHIWKCRASFWGRELLHSLSIR
jgi:hypothetical protein